MKLKRFVKYLCLSIAVWISAPPVFAEDALDDELRTMLVTGRAAVEDGFNDTAESSLRRFLEATQGNATAKAQRSEAAQLYLRSLAAQEKFDLLVKTLSSGPAWLGPIAQDRDVFWRAFALHRQGENEKAIPLLAGLEKRFPESALTARSMRLLATCLMATGNKRDAGLLFQRYDREFPDSSESGENLLDLARLLISEEQFALAGDTLTRLIQGDHETELEHEAQYWLGRTLTALGRLNDATNVLDFVTRGDVVRSDVATESWYALGGAQLGLNQSDRAIKSFEAGIKRAQDASLRRRGRRLLGTVHIQEKNFEEGVRILREVVQEEPDDPDASRMQLLLAQALSSQGQFLNAITEFQYFLESFSKSAGQAEAYLGKGHALSQLARHVEAAAAFEKAYALLTVEEDRVRALFLAGQAYMEDKQYHRAEDSFLALRRDHKSSPMVPNATFNLGRCYMLADELSEAEKAFAGLSRDFPTHQLASEALMQVAEMKWKAGQLPESMVTFSSLVTTYTNSPIQRRARMGRGLVRYELRSFKDALADFAAVCRADKNDTDAEQALYLIGLCQYWLGNGPQAVATQKDLLATYTNSPFTSRAQFWLAKYAFNQGEFADAENLFAQHYESAPADGRAEEALLWAGRAAVRQKEYIRAVERLGNLVKAFPEGRRLPDARFEQGNALCELAKFSEAILVFQEIINKHPDSDIIALALLRTGDCQFMLGATEASRYAEAVNAYTTCFETASDLPELQFHAQFKIGRCLQKQGKELEAVEHYYQSVMVPFLNTVDTDDGLDEASRTWFWRSAREAADILEQRGEWRKAVSVMERILGVGVPAEAVIRQRIKDIKAKHWWEFY